jgi:trehalose/maltose hydrolase-like predicted phosphorylase
MIAMAYQSAVRKENGERVESTSNAQDGRLVERWTWPAHMSELVRFTRLVAVYSSRDTEEPTSAARQHLRQAQDAGMDAHILRHTQAWEERWRAASLTVVGDDPGQRALRFAAYHLGSTLNPNDELTSIGARGLTGSVYKGHVFWDTEIYLLPFYTFTDPHDGLRLYPRSGAAGRLVRIGGRLSAHPGDDGDWRDDRGVVHRDLSHSGDLLCHRDTRASR